jgi:hypothetical protein
MTYSILNAVMLQVMANNSILGILSASSLEHQLLEICKASQTVIQKCSKNLSLHYVSNGLCEN